MNMLVIACAALIVCGAIRGLWSPCGLSMVSQIAPVTERARGHRFWATAIWFIIGGVVGGATLGALLAIGAWGVNTIDLSAHVRWSVVALVGMLGIASDLEAVKFRLPLHARQVNETWLRTLRSWAYASGFGWQIGTGFATYIMTGAVYLIAVVGIMTGDPRVAFLVGVSFGFVRGAQVLLTSRAHTHDDLRRLHQRIERGATWSIAVAIGVQLLVLVSIVLAEPSPVTMSMLGLAFVFLTFGAIQAVKHVRPIKRVHPSQPV